MARKPISKKIRFEVFKRDKFQCQYCGKVAPDVVLEVDHIDPVSNNGSNDIMNLITACFDCNRGKGKRTLADSETLKKSYRQVVDLAERQEQIKMMMDWKNAVSDMNRDMAEYFIKLLVNDYGIDECEITEKQAGQIRRAIKKYGLDAMELSAENIARQQEYKYGEINTESFIQKIRSKCYWDEDAKNHPEKKIPYIIKILNNRFPGDFGLNEKAIDYITETNDCTLGFINRLIDYSKTSKSLEKLLNIYGLTMEANNGTEQ